MDMQNEEIIVLLKEMRDTVNRIFLCYENEYNGSKSKNLKRR